MSQGTLTCMRTADRVLQLAGPDRVADAHFRLNLIWLRRFVLMHMAARSFLTIAPTPEMGASDVLRGATVLVAIAGLMPRFARPATAIATLLVLGDVLVTLPDTANHVFLEWLCLVLLTLFDEQDEDEAPLLLQGLRWMTGVFFFYTGLQKVLYGYYFDGQFLAFLAATDERFRLFFQHLIPSEELERLRAFNLSLVDADAGRWKPRVGAGPYRVDSLIFVLVSNITYIFEMVAGLLLLLPRTRVVAALASIVFVIMIELAARELTFGALMINLLLLFLPGKWNKWLFPAFAAGYLYLMLADPKLGLDFIPMFWYSPA